MNKTDLLKKIKTKKAKIAVIGLGYVGLPLVLEFAKSGFRVMGLDVDLDRVKRIKNKVSYISDVPTQDLKKIISSGKFTADTDFSLLEMADVIIICVPTPLKKKYSPDISFIISAVKQIRKYLRAGQLVVLESTTYSGTTEEIILPALESGSLKCGKDFYLAFSPERIDPGNSKFPVSKIPKVIGGVTKDATELTVALYKNIVIKTVPVSSAKVAETVKLLENTFRIVNIGLINEMAMMANKMGLDIWEIIDAAKTKPFGFMPFYPGPGEGGHCIPKDPLYLFWKAKKFGFNSRFIKLASDIITYMPEYVVHRVAEILQSNHRHLAASKILVIGATYKKDIKDLRKSPALDIINLLHKNKAFVQYHDPLIPFLKINGIDMRSVDLSGLNNFDCVIIATDHSNLNYGSILKKSKLIFDTRNIYKGKKSKNLVKL